MNVSDLVDDLYEAFVDGLGDPLGAYARDLPRVLGLAPRANCPWSDVFAHEVTLGAPALLSEGMNVTPDIVRDAVLAHALAVIDAFGTDRVEDQQVPGSPELLAVLGRARRHRDRAIGRVFGGPPLPDCDFARADARTTRALRKEREFLLASAPVDIHTYERESLEKQSAGIVASVALARVAGWDERLCRAVRSTLESVALGLQAYDDVVDWEDDLSRGGSWTVCLMKGRRVGTETGERQTEGARLRAQVLRSGVLLGLLRRAAHHMGAARRRAAALGAERLAAWAGSRQERFETLRAAESANAGYAVRAHALSAWAGEVLA
jgi:hypothetical protein